MIFDWLLKLIILLRINVDCSNSLIIWLIKFVFFHGNPVYGKLSQHLNVTTRRNILTCKVSILCYTWLLLEIFRMQFVQKRSRGNIERCSMCISLQKYILHNLFCTRFACNYIFFVPSRRYNHSTKKRQGRNAGKKEEGKKQDLHSQK